MLRNSTEEIAGIKNVIDFLSEKVDEPMHATKEISAIPSLVTKLQAVIAAKDKQLESLEETIDKLEQYSRR